MKEFLMRIKHFFDRNRWLIVFLLAVPFFNDSYEGIQIISDQTIDLIKIIVFVILFISMIVKKERPSLLFSILSLMEGWWMVTTVINYGFGYSTADYKTFIDIINALSVALIVECFKNDPENLIDGLMLNMELAIYPNFVSVLMNLSAVRGYYLLGYYAVLILWILPAICLASLYMILHKKYLRGLLLIAASLLTALITWCATIIVALMGMAFLMIVGIALWKANKKIRLPISAFILLALAGNLFVLFVYNGGSFPLIDIFIEKVLGRSTTFTGRVPIWQTAISMIRKNPFIGYGFRPEITIESGFTAIHAHNMLLQRLTATGIIGLALFVLFHIVLISKIDYMKNSIERIVMMSGVFAVNITYIMDAYKKFFRFYLVFFLAYHVDEFFKEKISNNEHLLK